MKTLLFLSIITLISSIYAPRLQHWAPPVQQWGSPEQVQWGPPQSEWGPPQSEGQPEWYPTPENQCKCKLLNIACSNYCSYLENTPSAEIDVTHDTVLQCDSTSRLKQVLSQTTIQGVKVTCNGIIVGNGDRSIELVYAEPEYGSEQKERVKLTNYTRIRSYNNGNYNYNECGTIANGKCAGDKISGFAIGQANDQNGCCKGGNSGNVALFRSVDIKGKCESRCSLVRSSQAYSEPISNRGLSLRALENEETTVKSEEYF